MNTSTLTIAPYSTCEAGRGTDPSRLSQGAFGVEAAAPMLGGHHGTNGAAQQRRKQLPCLAPILDELELGGWSSHRRSLAGNFHDWLLLGRGCVLAVVGQAVGLDANDPVAAAMAAQATWSTIRAHAHHTRDAGELLSLASKTLWTDTDQDLHVSVAVALVETSGGHASLATAGDCLVWRVRAAKLEQIPATQPPLGSWADCSYHADEISLSLRERLLMLADNPHYRAESLVSEMADSFSHFNAEKHRRMTAHDAVGIARQQYESLAGRKPLTSASLAVLRRR